MIPETIDPVAMLDALSAWGWKDVEIELSCGFSKGYISHIRSGRIKTLYYPTAARLINFHEKNVPCGTDRSQTNVVASVS